MTIHEPEIEVLSSAYFIRIFFGFKLLLFRLSWQKVWSAPAQDKEVLCLAWRPDGKVLAVGRVDGAVQLLDVEHGSEIHCHTLAHPVHSMRWVRTLSGHQQTCSPPASGPVD